MADSATVTAARERHAPADVDTVARLLRDGAADRASVVITGAGSKLGWAGPVIAPQVELNTGRLDQLIDYRPDDMTVAVQAGMPLVTLQQILAERGQWLALDPPTESAGATIGGLLVSGDAGPRRLRYGTLRDLAIGCTLVLADGTIAHAGGHVIKNVAGYDLTKLMYGSLGTLALVGELVLRLNPIPVASRTIRCTATPRLATRAASAVIASGVEPSAIEWSGTPTSNGILMIGLDGTARSIQPAVAHAVRALVELGVDDAEVVTIGPSTSSEPFESVKIPELPNIPEPVEGQPGPATIRLGTLPDQFPMIADKINSLAERLQVEVALASSTGLGLHTARLSGPIAGQAAMIDELGALVQQLDGTLALRDRDPELDHVRGTTAPMPKPPQTVGLQRAIKDRFDPDHRLAPGRFAPWF